MYTHTLHLEEKLGGKVSKDNKRNCRRARIPVRLFQQKSEDLKLQHGTGG